MISNILNRVKPKNKTDLVTLFHDIAYLHNHDSDAADYKAIRDSDNSWQGLATKVGLLGRTLSGIRFNAKEEYPYIKQLYDKAVRDNLEMIQREGIDLPYYNEFNLHD